MYRVNPFDHTSSSSSVFEREYHSPLVRVCCCVVLSQACFQPSRWQTYHENLKSITDLAQYQHLNTSYINLKPPTYWSMKAHFNRLCLRLCLLLCPVWLFGFRLFVVCFDLASTPVQPSPPPLPDSRLIFANLRPRIGFGLKKESFLEHVLTHLSYHFSFMFYFSSLCTFCFCGWFLGLTVDS